jgi:hypothetical protein
MFTVEIIITHSSSLDVPRCKSSSPDYHPIECPAHLGYFLRYGLLRNGSILGPNQLSRIAAFDDFYSTLSTEKSRNFPTLKTQEDM